MNRSNSVHYLTLFFSKTNPFSCHSFCWKSMLHNLFGHCHVPWDRPRFEISRPNQDTPLRLVRQVVDFDIRPCPVRNRTNMEQNNHEFGRKTWKITQKEAWRDFQWFASKKTTGMANNNWFHFSDVIPGRPADDFSNGRACFADPRREQGVL